MAPVRILAYIATMSELADLRVMMQAEWVDLATLASKCWVNVDAINTRAYIIARCNEIIAIDHYQVFVDDATVLAAYGLDDQPTYIKVKPRVAAAIVFREAPGALVQRLVRDHLVGCYRETPDRAILSRETPGDVVLSRSTIGPSPDQLAQIARLAQMARSIATETDALVASAVPVAPRTSLDGFLDAVKTDFESKQPAERMFDTRVNIPAKAFYTKYVEWITTRGEHPLTMHVFGRDVKARVTSGRAADSNFYRIDRIA